VREKELLATTLASIGDAVIVTDAQGRVMYINAEAERLTKWSNAEAVRQPLPTVFRIVHEETRAPVEDPVEKVLRLGGIVDSQITPC
jgi:PAS domain S-box-containing protein